MKLWVVVGALAVSGLTACGSSASVEQQLEVAIAKKQVAGLFGVGVASLAGFESPRCSPPDSIGHYHCDGRPRYVTCKTPKAALMCAGPLMPGRIGLECFSSALKGPRFFCGVAPPHTGQRVFTTPAQRAAPKEAIWKCVDVDALDRDVGDFLVYYKSLSWPYEVAAESITETEAKQLARKTSVPLSIDCPVHRGR